MRHQKIQVEIWSKDPSAFHGYIMRSPLHQRQFGNFGAIEYSVLGKRYWSVGGKELTLPLEIIAQLKTKKELIPA